MAMAGMVGILYFPSLYAYIKETNPLFAPVEAKSYLSEKNYQDLVAKFKPYVRELRKAGQKVLSYEDKLLIYSEFLNLI